MWPFSDYAPHENCYLVINGVAKHWEGKKPIPAKRLDRVVYVQKGDKTRTFDDLKALPCKEGILHSVKATIRFDVTEAQAASLCESLALEGRKDYTVDDFLNQQDVEGALKASVRAYIFNTSFTDLLDSAKVSAALEDIVTTESVRFGIQGRLLSQKVAPEADLPQGTPYIVANRIIVVDATPLSVPIEVQAYCFEGIEHKILFAARVCFAPSTISDAIKACAASTSSALCQLTVRNYAEAQQLSDLIADCIRAFVNSKGFFALGDIESSRKALQEILAARCKALSLDIEVIACQATPVIPDDKEDKDGKGARFAELIGRLKALSDPKMSEIASYFERARKEKAEAKTQLEVDELTAAGRAVVARNAKERLDVDESTLTIKSQEKKELAEIAKRAAVHEQEALLERADQQNRDKLTDLALEAEQARATTKNELECKAQENTLAMQKQVEEAALARAEAKNKAQVQARKNALEITALEHEKNQIRLAALSLLTREETKSLCDSIAPLIEKGASQQNHQLSFPNLVSIGSVKELEHFMFPPYGAVLEKFLPKVLDLLTQKLSATGAGVQKEREHLTTALPSDATPQGAPPGIGATSAEEIALASAKEAGAAAQKYRSSGSSHD